MEEKEKKDNKKNSKKKLFIIIGIIVVLAVIGGIVYATFIRNVEDNCINETNNLIGPPYSDGFLKPIIYLYPEQETEINVVVGRPENLTHTYPKYNNGWNVIAKANGDLIDVNTGRSLYALYWEGKNDNGINMQEGFVIKGEDTIEFLEEKLAILGLNEREANEFIIYWLPKLENNKYNFIRFQTIEEIDNNMPLAITPAPDTIIRVMMEFKALNEEINVKEQTLVAPQRNGYIVVEWGGTEII